MSLWLQQQQAFIIVVVVVCLLATTTTTEGLALGRKAQQQNVGGYGIGRLILDTSSSEEGAVQCHYDMVLVERLQGRPKQESGLFIPDDQKPFLHLAKVLSVGPGREEENGYIAPMPDIKVGDIVVAKHPWGIGPKDEETPDGKKLSYMRSFDIAAKLSGTIIEESQSESES
eukprot:CAMPEP_0118706100 /NCGR_PEP_ID=MMETSP0800-20121206/20331_1 /TAXON_ID=210618 ORGANISM="Striatella unipunctata, Strain CCMP2910" /NCGR_SAMPLE_ID=MMETSP0800 /ASSEMBLY_ACC=CAM_ASM_000638 /LENGTH=171 /DNA_ID=CAMNT_0006608519 /DNA_START=64 /DNA_END=579 /DNA_ORIENTATION=-